MRRLHFACEDAKRELTNRKEASIEVKSILPMMNLECSISRAKFDELNSALFMKCLGLVDKVRERIVHR